MAHKRRTRGLRFFVTRLESLLKRIASEGSIRPLGPWPVKAHSKATCEGLHFLADSDGQIDPARWCVAVDYVG